MFIGSALVNTYMKFRLIIEVQEVFGIGVLLLGSFFSVLLMLVGLFGC